MIPSCWGTIILIHQSINVKHILGHLLYSTPTWIWLGTLVIFLLLLCYKILIKKERTKEETKNSTIPDTSDKTMIDVGWYLSGYPKLANQIQQCIIYSKNGQLWICSKEQNRAEDNDEKSSIPLECVSNILIEDAYKFKSNELVEEQTPKEFLSFLNNKIENERESELAFLLIKWKKDLVEQCTSFCIDGEYALEKALITRNLIKDMCKR